MRSTVLLAIAALVPLLLFAAVGAAVALYRQRVDFDDRLIGDARRISEAVDRELAASLDSAQDLALQPSLDGKPDLKTFAEVAGRQKARHPLWVTVILLNDKGERLVNTEAPGHLGPAVDAASAHRALTDGAPLIGNMTMGAGRFGIPVRAPVMRNGAAAYVVTVVLAPQKIQEALHLADVPKDRIATVIDAQGVVVARTRGAAHFVGKKASSPALDARETAPNGIYAGHSLDGVRTHSAFWTSPVSGWSVHIGLPAAIYEAPLRRTETFTIGGLCLSLLLAGAFVVLLVREQRLRRSESTAIEQAQRLEALGRLTGGVAHDFNNLLMIIKGNVDILTRRLPDGAGEKQLAAIRIASDRAVRLTRELLIFARGGVATKTRLDLNAVITNFLGAIQEAAGTGVSVDLELDAAAPAVEVDRVQLEMAILNLTVNARDAMGGQGALTIATHTSGDRARLVLCDTGPGVKPEDLHRVFDPFFTTKLASGGTGLGLTQVYSFARQSGGEAFIENRKSGGAIVTLVLPRTAAPEAEVEATGENSPTDLRGRRILLTDDNDGVRKVAANYLRELGVTVVEASDAAEALSRYEDGAFDAVVSDIVMPGEMDGLGLARTLAERGAAILLVSGYSISTNEARSQGLPVLPKPYDLPDLARELAKILPARS